MPTLGSAQPTRLRLHLSPLESTPCSPNRQRAALGSSPAREGGDLAGVCVLRSPGPASCQPAQDTAILGVCWPQCRILVEAFSAGVLASH